MISPFIIINLLLEFRKYDLPFPLLCDTELKLVQELGVYGEKKMAGRTYNQGFHFLGKR
jgi:bacterioferritin comigratory protein